MTAPAFLQSTSDLTFHVFTRYLHSALSNFRSVSPMSHRLTDSPADFFRRLVPFGLAAEKPQHFRDMGRIVWENRDNLPYAIKVLTQGVCDGCALGVAGLHDWTIDGVHLCTT